jgi:glycerol-3-phosphate acyltransferase PlsX
MRIAIDVMGGDQDSAEIIAAGLRFASEFEQVKIRFVGRQESIQPHLSELNLASIANIDVLYADQVVEMSDRPSLALRQKKRSSMHLAIKQVASNESDACVSSGNTGALMAIGRHLLRMIPGVDRPAIIKAIPSTKGRCYLLDLGANIGCDAENLVQFAAMGSILCQSIEGIAAPKVGLLNVGEEEIKGEAEVRIAADLLKEHDKINFIGFVEGDGIYQSEADVIVCDGWVGNVALKTSEGLAKFVRQMIAEAFGQNMLTKAQGLIAYPVLEKLNQQLRPDNYNGAILLGLNGIVVKSHGRSTIDGFYQAICEAHKAISQQLPDVMKENIGDVLGTDL